MSFLLLNLRTELLVAFQVPYLYYEYGLIKYQKHVSYH